MIGLAVLTAFSIEAHAFPERTVRLIVPVAAGGSIDVTARVLGDALSKKWKQPVIIENRAGANMIVGTEAVAKSPPDGYTLLVGGAGPMTINVATIPDLSYDPRRDFTSVAMISSVPYVLVVNEAAGMNSVADIIRIGKQDPEKLNFASGGPAAQLAGALFKKMSGIGFVEIPFRGAAPSVQSVSAGDTHLTFADTATPGLDAPGAKLLAVTTSTRVEKLPQLPTLSEAGVAGYDYSAWIALFAPKQIPAEVRKIIEQDTLAVLADPEVRKRLEALQMEVVPLGGDALGKKVDAEIDKWSILVKETGLKLR
jgi:tripartite-type tricarboxylate transporter receptor subunit TctC